MEELKDFMFLLQVSAVTAVASVLILGVSADLFAVEPTGIVEPNGRQIHALRYRSRWAAGFRHIVFGVGMFMATGYTPLLGAIIISNTMSPGLFTASILVKWFVIIVSATILAVTWIAFMAIVLRWQYMRNWAMTRTT